MKRNLITLLFCVISSFVYSQSRVYDNPVSDYYFIYKFDRIEVTPNQTIADLTLEFLPNYWIVLEPQYYLRDKEGRKYKLLKAEGLEIGKRVYMDASGKLKAKLFFEPIPKDVDSFDFICDSKTPSNCTYNVKFTNDCKLPDVISGNWITTDGSNKWMYGFQRKAAFFDNKIWNYAGIKKSGVVYEISLECDGEKKNIFVKSNKNGNLLIGETRKSFVEYGRNFTQSENGDREWVFTPEKYRNTIYKKGKVLLRGYIEGYTPEIGFSTTAITLYDFAGNSNKNVLVEIAPDGRFETSFELEHPTYIMIMELKANTFVSPGDTLLMYCNIRDSFFARGYGKSGNNLIKYMGDSESVDVNNLRNIIMSNIGSTSTDYRNIQIKASQGVDSVLKLKQGILNDIKNIADSSKIVFEKYNVSDYVKDLMFTDMITDKITTLFDIAMFYRDGQYLTDDKGRLTINPEFVPLKGYFGFLCDFKQDFLDNPLVVTSSVTWTPFNRFEFCELASNTDVIMKLYKDLRKNTIEDIKRKNSILIDDSLKNDINAYIELGALSSKIIENKKLFDLLNNYYVSIFDDDFFDIEIQNTVFQNMTNAGLDRCIMYDYTLCRNIFNEAKNPEFTDKKILSAVTAALPYIKTPFIAEKLVELYASRVNYAKRDNEVSDPKADEVLERIIAPYKGNVLLLDFWNLGCGPCRSGMINDRERVEALKNNKIKFLYITDEPDSALDAYNKFLSENNIKGEQIRISKDDWNYLAAKFGISGIPHHALINKKGEIVSKKTRDIYNDTLLKLEKEE